MIDGLSALMKKVDHIQEHEWYQKRCGNSKQRIKGDARNQKHRKRDEESF